MPPLTSMPILRAEVSIHRQPSAERDLVEAFINERFRHKYGCSVPKHYPTLMSVADVQGQVAAAVGLRLAADEMLFLEHYLNQPIEAALSGRFPQAVHRGSIVEIGSLASLSRGASLILFGFLMAFLRQQRLDYAVVTATEKLRRMFARLGIAVSELGPAEPTALPDKGASWGSYYRSNPKVIVGATAQAFSWPQLTDRRPRPMPGIRPDGELVVTRW